jgi:polysaccharide chain length determinant protein (PEP-CTERM system associated)
MDLNRAASSNGGIVNTSLATNARELWRIVCRRKGLLSAVFLVVLSLAAYLAATLPPVYQSRTLILITPQRLPSSYVGTTVTSTIEQRVKTIAQQILGSASLEPIIRELGLYGRTDREVPMEERVRTFRRKINIVTGRGIGRGRPADSFELTFDAESPEKAMQVAGRLSSLFIEENLKVREQQAASTTSFINAEAERLRKDLEIQEAQVNAFRAAYRYELPEQLDANLRMLDQARRELENGLLRLSSLQERKAALEKQISEVEAASTEMSVAEGTSTGLIIPLSSPSETRRNELENLRQKYSDKHPDVVRLKRDIELLEAREARALPPQQYEGASRPTNNAVLPRTSLRDTLSKQLQDLALETESLRSMNGKLRQQIAIYQTRVDNAPVRAIELSKTSRNYDITLGKYKDLLAKRLESELSENMERKQKGEQFQVIDPPTLPTNPVAPNRPRILVIGLLLGLAGAFGSAFLLEKLNLAFNKAEDLEGVIDIPVLAALPAVATRGTILERRRAQGLLVAGSLGALALGLVIIRLFGSSLLGL